jgi:hypothetical protein
MSIHKLQDLCYAYSVADPVREMLFALQDRITELEAQRKPLTDELYNELLFAVGSKYPDETRHQTALRYIKRAEMRSASPAKAAHGIKGEA